MALVCIDFLGYSWIRFMWTFKTFGFSLIFGQLCDKKTCAFVVMGIGKKFVWAGGGDGQKSLSRLSLFCWRVCLWGGGRAGCEHFEEGENVDPPRFHSFINFFNWSLPSLLNRTKGQLKFPARGEELALERVVEVVVHAKQQIRIVTQTVSVADVRVPAMKWLHLK